MIRLLVGLAIIAPVLAHFVVDEPWKFLLCLSGAVMVFGVDKWIMSITVAALEP